MHQQAFSCRTSLELADKLTEVEFWAPIALRTLILAHTFTLRSRIHVIKACEDVGNLDVCYSAAYMSQTRNIISALLSHLKWQLISMS